MNRIRELRESREIQQKELAISLGVSQPTVSDWESGRKLPSAKSTMKLANFFNVSVEYLMGVSDRIDRLNNYCPLCGFNFLSDGDEASNEHQFAHKRAENALRKFGFFYNYFDRERIKGESRSFVSDTSKSFDDRVKTQLNIFQALFSRSVENYGAENHPSFEDYISMILKNHSLEGSTPVDILEFFKKRYGEKEGIPQGTYYFGYKKEPVHQDELWSQNASILTQLSPQELQRVMDFVEGLKAARSVTDSPHK